MRRPPIAERRLLEGGPEESGFLTKDGGDKGNVECRYSLQEFVERLSNHVPDRYTNNVRYLALLAPRTKRRLWQLMFLLAGSAPAKQARILALAYTLKKHFGVDPLIDSDSTNALGPPHCCLIDQN